MPLFSDVDTIKCEYCGYKIAKPYPRDMVCPRCRKFFTKPGMLQKTEPKQFHAKTTTISSKFKGKVRVKQKAQDISLESDKIELKKGKEYIKLIGITSVERTPLYCSNKKLTFLLELTNNLDYIATGILGGELDKMLLITDDNEEVKCQFDVKDNIIYLAYGVFPDKKGKWLLEQVQKHYSDLVKGKDVNNLDKLEKHDIDIRIKSRLKYILKEYMDLQEVFSDQEIPYVEDKIRVDYLGLSSKTIGVISLLLGDKFIFKEIPGNLEDPAEVNEMKESIMTAKIEAIAANTVGNTGATPRWIAVKLGFQNYRFLTFKQYKNGYFLYMLSEGNLKKIDVVEEELDIYFDLISDNPFSGNLRPFNELRLVLKELLEKKREFS